MKRDRHFRLQYFSSCSDGKQPLGFYSCSTPLRSFVNTGGPSPKYQQWEYTITYNDVRLFITVEVSRTLNVVSRPGGKRDAALLLSQSMNEQGNFITFGLVVLYREGLEVQVALTMTIRIAHGRACLTSNERVRKKEKGGPRRKNS